MLRPYASRPNTRLDLNRVIMLFGNSPHHCAIPLVSVSSTGEDRRAAFERYVLGRCNLVATHVSADHEVTHFVAGDTVRYIRQDCVEAIQL